MERFFAHLKKNTRKRLAYFFLSLCYFSIVLMLTVGISYAICGDNWIDNAIDGKYDTSATSATLCFVVPALAAFNFWMLYFDARKRSFKEYLTMQDVFTKEGVILKEEKLAIKEILLERMSREIDNEKKQEDKFQKKQDKINERLGKGLVNPNE